MRTITYTLLAAVVAMLAVPAHAQWTEVRSNNFIVVSNAGDRQARDVAAGFEQLRSLFGGSFRRTRVSTPVPLTIVVFGTPNEAREHAPLLNGKPADVISFVEQGEDRNFMVLGGSSQIGLAPVLHDYAHLLLSTNYPRTQPWFDEGFAEYFAGMTIGNKDVEIGAPPSAEILGTAPLMPVVQLFSAPLDEPAEGSDKRSLFHAQSWLAVRWIFEQDKLAQVGPYFNLVMNQKVPVADAIQQAFGVSPKDLDAQLAAFVAKAREPARRTNLPLELNPNTFSGRKLTDSQGAALLADLHLHTPGRREQALREFQNIVEADPNNAIAHRGLGTAYVWSGELDKARPHLHRAIELDPRDARAHYYLAVVLNQGSQSGVETDRGAQPIASELMKAVELDPLYGDAYRLLAAAQMALHRPQDALKYMRQALALNPRNDSYRLTMANLLASNGQYDESKKLLGLLQSSPEPQIAQEAKAMLGGMDRLIAQRQQWAEQGLSSYTDPTDPRWKPKPGQDLEKEDKPPKEEKPDTRKVEYVKGTLVAVDCSTAPGATLTISGGGRTWKMRTADTSKVILIGADAFDCGWKDVKASVNYKASGPGQGDLVSVEVD